MSRILAATAMVALSMFLLPSITLAANPVRFDFTGTVTSIPTDPGGDLAGSGIAVTDTVSGSYFFDGDASSQNAADGTNYLGAMTYYSKTTIENRDFFAFAGLPINSIFIEIRVKDAGLGATEELYFAEMGQLSSELVAWELTLQNPTDTSAIIGEALPLTPPNLAPFATKEVEMLTQGGSRLIFDLNTLTLPEPGAAASLAAIVGAFGVLGRRKTAKGQLAA